MAVKKVKNNEYWWVSIDGTSPEIAQISYLGKELRAYTCGDEEGWKQERVTLIKRIRKIPSPQGEDVGANAHPPEGRGGDDIT